MVRNRHKKIIVRAQVSLGTTDDNRTVRIAKLLSDDTDGVGLSVAQVACKEVGPVI
jgi:hypothetical protein